MFGTGELYYSSINEVDVVRLFTLPEQFNARGIGVRVTDKHSIAYLRSSCLGIEGEVINLTRHDEESRLSLARVEGASELPSLNRGAQSSMASDS